jgi:hypothetical protein
VSGGSRVMPGSVQRTPQAGGKTDDQSPAISTTVQWFSDAAVRSCVVPLPSRGSES